MSTTIPPPPPSVHPLPPPTATSATPSSPPAGYLPVYAYDASRLQRVGIGLVRVATAVAFWFGFIGILVENFAVDPYSSTPPSETLLRWTTWAYRVDDTGFGWTYTRVIPPIGVILCLAVAAVGTFATRKASNDLLRARRLNHFPKPLLRRGPELSHDMGLLTGRMRSLRGTRSDTLFRSPVAAWILLVVSMLGSIGMIFLGRYALATDIPDRGLDPGVGPTVCVVAGAVALVGALMALPWRTRRFAIGPNGEVEVAAPPAP